MAFIFRSPTTYDAMVQLLNEQDEKEQDRLTEQWKANKIEELNFIGIVGALLAGVLTSTGSWPNMLEGSTQTPWSIRTCWFCGIDFALAAVITAASQAIRLHRLSCRSDGLRSIRLLLCMNHRRRDGRVLPQRRQVVLWQLAILWLVISAVLMIVGLLMLSWKAASAGGWWSGQAQLALIYSILTVLILLVFAWEQWVLFSWDAIDEAGKNGCALGDPNSHEG